MPAPPSHPQLLRLALYLLDETNVIVTSLTALWAGRNLLLNRRPAGSLYFITGAIGTMVLAKTLKRTFRIPRPSSHKPSSTTSRYLSTVRPNHTSYGFPSTHSATISFFSTYIFLSLVYPPSSLSNGGDNRHAYRANPILGTAALMGGAVVCWSRTKLGHHDVAQVVAGMALGVGCGLSHWIGWHGSAILGGQWEGWRLRGEGLWDLAEVVGKRVWGQMTR